MRKAAVCAVLWGGIALASAAGAAEAPLAECSGLPCAGFELGEGKSATLLIDTGNNRGVLDIGTARRLGLEIRPFVSRSGKTLDGVFTATLGGLKLGGQQLGEAEFLVMDLKKSIAEGSFPEAEGTVSYTSFKDRVLSLDYAKHRLTFGAPGETVAAPAHSGDLSYPTFGPKGPPIVVASGFAVNGKPVSAQVDTLYSGSLLVYSASVAKLGLEGEATAKATRHFPFTDGGVDMIEGRAGEEGFAGKALLSQAGLYFPTPDVHQPDGLFDATVGQELFAGHRLTLDFHANKLWLD